MTAGSSEQWSHGSSQAYTIIKNQPLRQGSLSGLVCMHDRYSPAIPRQDRWLLALQSNVSNRPCHHKLDYVTFWTTMLHWLHENVNIYKWGRERWNWMVNLQIIKLEIKNIYRISVKVCSGRGRRMDTSVLVQEEGWSPTVLNLPMVLFFTKIMEIKKNSWNHLYKFKIDGSPSINTDHVLTFLDLYMSHVTSSKYRSRISSL